MNKKYIFLACAAMTMPLIGSAQSAIDAYSLSQFEQRGTARFMSMGGAFTALGGDLSVLTQNPGGIGIYRSSEVGVTVELDFQKGNSATDGFKESISQTKFRCNNFGYIGSVRTGSEVMPYFNWGASYTRTASFDRRYRGQMRSVDGSLTNYVAGFTTAKGWESNKLYDPLNDTWNPYYNTAAPWSSILFYNSYLINPTGDKWPDVSDSYNGLWQNGTSGSSAFDVREKGHVDEYAIDFGGNFAETVYWGIGFGITDIRFDKSVYYEEDFSDARITNVQANGAETGKGGYGLLGSTRISGSGFNFKAGVIVKPINELRIGLAIHTPTYYNLQQYNGGSVDYGFSSGFDNGLEYANDGYEDRTDWKLRTPWRLMAGVAGVIGRQAIVSLDYEYRPYQDMTMKDRNGNDFNEMNGDIDNYYQASNIIRVGAEYRLTPRWSLRAGYSYETTSVTDRAANDEIPVYTSGVSDTGLIPSYAFDKSTQYISVGVGYHYKNFYIDAAYVHKKRDADFHAFTASDYTGATPYGSSVTNHNNNIVVGLGFKF